MIMMMIMKTEMGTAAWVIFVEGEVVVIVVVVNYIVMNIDVQ